MKRITLYSYALLLATGLLSSSCQSTDSAASSGAAPAKPKPITQVVGVARIEPEAGLIDVYAGTNGTIANRPVAESQLVAKGQVLLSLDQTTDNAQISQFRAKLGTQQATIAAQQANVETLRLTADKAQADYELNQQLYVSKGITGQTLRDSEANAAQRRQEYRKGQADLKQAQAKLREMSEDVRYYRVQAGQKTVRSPYAGKLLAWEVKLGDYVTAQTKIAQMAPAGPLVAVTEVDELFAERVQSGQRADIRSQATGRVIATGEVVFAADYLKKKSLFADETSQEDRRVREVKVRLLPNANVLINSRVDCLIHLN
ncbi:HlyD family secretion protein [Spirosoma montaniterrae]|uniref:Uncharacterized protein n=1 Tax=Spirosoma montaniterrae TaxID=1178516 RepID=A0A1P9X2B7_9BACT|nr:HlyD family efflux transporter periplasmic adaptor subunit [Spirosoma montaniterrae]AQG81735.1 hypothetical protein AWR27_21980 [Spirosoma montaniterrae]